MPDAAVSAGWALGAAALLGLLVVLAAVLDGFLTARVVGAGPSGWTRPLGELARLMRQRGRTTVVADTLLWRIGSAGLLVMALMIVTVVPLGEWTLFDLDVGVVWFNAMDVLAWAFVWLTGWGANSAHSLVGGYRFLAHGLAYELPLMFALVAPAVAAGEPEHRRRSRPRRRTCGSWCGCPSRSSSIAAGSWRSRCGGRSHRRSAPTSPAGCSRSSPAWTGCCFWAAGTPCSPPGRRSPCRCSSAAVRARCCPAGCGAGQDGRVAGVLVWLRGGCPRCARTGSSRPAGWCCCPPCWCSLRRRCRRGAGGMTRDHRDRRSGCWLSSPCSPVPPVFRVDSMARATLRAGGVVHRRRHAAAAAAGWTTSVSSSS